MSRWAKCPPYSKLNPAGTEVLEAGVVKIRAVDLDNRIRRPLPYPTYRLGLAAARPRILAAPFP